MRLGFAGPVRVLEEGHGDICHCQAVTDHLGREVRAGAGTKG